MIKLLFRVAILVGGVYAVRSLLAEDSAPKVFMSGLSRLHEQNEQLLALQREQNELLRERLGVREAASQA